MKAGSEGCCLWNVTQGKIIEQRSRQLEGCCKKKKRATILNIPPSLNESHKPNSLHLLTAITNQTCFFLLLLLFNLLFAHLINTANGPDRLTGFEKNCLLCQDTEFFFPSFSPNGDPHQLPWLLTVSIPVSLLETKSVPGGFWPVSLYRCRRQIKLCLEATAKKTMIVFLGSS